MDLAAHHLDDIRIQMRKLRTLAEGAIEQVSDKDLFRQLDPESNSIAIVVRHVGGNLKSRFRDFLTTDGEKPDRHRDGEFEMPERVTRAEIMRWWNEGWATALGSIEALTPADLERTVYVRGEPLLVIETLNRLVTHAAYHVGQIVFLSKHFAASNWQSLSIPRGMSEQIGRGTYKQTFVPRGR